MRITDTSDLWWKNAVIYCLDVERYFDSDGDGVGDLQGLAQRIDYLAELGVTCLWLMPFYPTPNRDDGYDVMDHYGVDRRLGTLGDLVEIIRTARDRGMRVIADLVVNHTSDQHPWFKASRSSKDNPYRDYYVWRSDPPPDTSEEVVFPDQEDGIWEYDEKTGEWYQHRFYRHQPDLNVDNPAVRDEISRVIGFWLQMGMSGFRVDAVPYFLESTGQERSADEDGLDGDPHGYLAELRAFVGRRRGDAVLLGEVNLPYERQLEYFGGDDGDELHMQFDFVGMQKMYLSLARCDAGPLADALASRPEIATVSQWATFVRNHDELTLDKLTDGEREEVFAAFGPEERMQIFGRGLKRRLPPMLEGDPRRVRMVYSLLFSLPGTPVLFYGEEIGMGEDLDADGRHAVRTPMQWTSEKGAGFSTASPRRFASRVVDGAFGPEFVNVADQRRDPDSLWSYVSRLIQRYRECPELGWGDVEILDQPHASVLAHRCTWGEASIVALHNLSNDPVIVPLRLPDLDEGSRLVDLLADGSFDPDEKGRVEIPLESYGHTWLRVQGTDDRRLP